MPEINEECCCSPKEALQLGFDSILKAITTRSFCSSCRYQEHLVNLQNFTGKSIRPWWTVGGHIRSLHDGPDVLLVWVGIGRPMARNLTLFLLRLESEGQTAYVIAQKYKQNARSKALTKVGPPTLVQDAKLLWKASKSRPEYTSESVYTILHSKTLRKYSVRAGAARYGREEMDYG